MASTDDLRSEALSSLLYVGDSAVSHAQMEILGAAYASPTDLSNVAQGLWDTRKSGVYKHITANGTKPRAYFRQFPTVSPPTRQLLGDAQTKSSAVPADPSEGKVLQVDWDAVAVTDSDIEAIRLHLEQWTRLEYLRLLEKDKEEEKKEAGEGV